MATTIRHYLAPELIGRDPADVAGAHAVMDSSIAPAFSTGQPIAKAGIDLAFHDLAGKRAGQNVTTLWGRAPGAPLTLSWTVNPRTLDEIDGLVEAGRALGYRHFNVKVAPDPAFDLELCRRVKKLAPDGFLWADANCGYDVEAALRVAPRLADAGVDVFEAPLRPNRISGYQALARQRALPILMDEGHFDPGARRVHPARDARRRCHEAGPQWRASHGPQADLDRQRCRPHVARQRPDRSRHLVGRDAGALLVYGQSRPCALNGPQFLAHSIVETPFTPKDGQLAPPTGPGLGVVVNEARLRAIAATD